MIVVDTNVISEMLRLVPSPEVLAWMRAAPAGDLYTTAVTKAEIAYGLAILPLGRRRDSMTDQFLSIFSEDFERRVLPFDAEAALAYAEIAAARRRAGRPVSVSDTQIAAITRVAGFSLATRNTRDFEESGIDLINPWAVV